MRHYYRLVFLTVIATALLLVGCTQPAVPGSGGGAGTEEVAKARAKIDPSRCEPNKEWWRSPNPPVRGGQAVMAAQPEIVTHLDPTSGGNGGHRVTQELIVSRGCFVGDLVLMPYLAKSWTVSADGLTWTFKLREDVKWHNVPPVNGRPFNSADVKFNHEIQLGGGPQRSIWEQIGKLETPDPMTVVMTLKDSDADFGVKLTKTLMLPKEVKDQFGDFKTVSIGTGPYMAKEYKPNTERTLARNPNYWEMGVDNKPLPYLDTIFFPTFGDYTAELAAMRTNQIDVGNTLGYRKLDWDNLKAANPKLVPWDYLITTPFAVFFNHKEKPWDDVRVRRAVQKAMSLDDLIASNYGGVLVTGYIPSFFRDFSLPEDEVRKRMKQDVEGAKKILADAGYKPGDIKAVLKTSGAYQQDAEISQQLLRNIGIETTLNSEGSAFSNVVRGKDFSIAAGVIGGSAWASHFGHDVIVSNGSTNYWNFNDPQVDALARAQNRELDPAKRKQLMRQLEDKLWETIPFVPTVIRYYYYFYSCRSQNTMFISSNATHNQQFYTHMWLDAKDC